MLQSTTSLNKIKYLALTIKKRHYSLLSECMSGKSFLAKEQLI